MIWPSLGTPFNVTQYIYSAYNTKIRNQENFEMGPWCLLTFRQMQTQLQSCSAPHLQKKHKQLCSLVAFAKSYLHRHLAALSLHVFSIFSEHNYQK